MVDDMKRLLKTAYEQGASDLHIIVASPPVLRIDGKLQPVSDTQFDPQWENRADRQRDADR